MFYLDTPRSSPRLANRARSHLQREVGATGRDRPSPKHDIVVVTEGASKQDRDLELQVHTTRGHWRGRRPLGGTGEEGDH